MLSPTMENNMLRYIVGKIGTILFIRSDAINIEMPVCYPFEMEARKNIEH